MVRIAQRRQPEEWIDSLAIQQLGCRHQTSGDVNGRIMDTKMSELLCKKPRSSQLEKLPRLQHFLPLALRFVSLFYANATSIYSCITVFRPTRYDEKGK
jgi:hypothetical protein